MQFFTFNFIYRLLGGLLSAHLLIVDENKYMGDFDMENYENELLEMYCKYNYFITFFCDS